MAINFGTGSIKLYLPAIKYDLQTRLLDDDGGMSRHPYNMIGCTPVKNFPASIDLPCSLSAGSYDS